MSGGLTRVAILGTGRMGSRVAEAARERGVEVVAHLGRSEVTGDADAARTALAEAGVAIDFTTPDAAVGNIDLCLSAGCAAVVGTTGWYSRLDEVTAAVHARGGALLWAANFSLGVALMKALAGRTATLLAGLDDFDVHLVETHHRKKRDAPSGTALTLVDAMSGRLGRDVPVTSVRVGEVPGTHELIVDGGHEQLRLSHSARDPRVFAEGALHAAEWLSGRTGVYTMDDVVNLERT